MDTKDLLNKITILEQEVTITPQIVRDILNTITGDNIDIEPDEELVVEKINTMYSEYKLYGLSYESVYIMPWGDYKSYLGDICDEMKTCLPDGLDEFFNSKLLMDKIQQSGKNDSNYYLEACIEFINKNKDEDYYKYVMTDSGQYEGVEYVIVEEKL